MFRRFIVLEVFSVEACGWTHDQSRYSNVNVRTSIETMHETRYSCSLLNIQKNMTLIKERRITRMNLPYKPPSKPRVSQSKSRMRKGSFLAERWWSQPPTADGLKSSYHPRDRDGSTSHRQLVLLPKTRGGLGRIGHRTCLSQDTPPGHT